MVGWIPPQELRLSLLHKYLERVKACQNETGPNDTACLLHYDATSGDMTPYAWPVLENARVTPDMLNWHRHTHFFLAPSCPCALLDGRAYTEAKIGLVHQVAQPASAECLGQYVAMCAEQRCGYFVLLEPFYSHPSLMVKTYPSRGQPILCKDPFYFTTGDTAETAKMAGLRQFQVLRDESNTGIRGTRHLLRREDPEGFWKLEDEIEKLLTKGLAGTKFWDLFVQCTQCNYVMPSHHFPYFHECASIVVKGYELAALTRSYRSTLLDKVDSNASAASDSDLDSNMAVEEYGAASSTDDLPTLATILAGNPTSRLPARRNSLGAMRR